MLLLISQTKYIYNNEMILIMIQKVNFIILIKKGISKKLLKFWVNIWHLAFMNRADLIMSL